MRNIELKVRQQEILEIVKAHQPITSENIAKYLNVSRSALRSDLTVLTMSGFLEAKPKVGYFYVKSEERERLSKLIQSTKVGNLMSLPIVIDEKSSVYDGIVAMFLEDVGTLIIVSEGYLVGVVSRKDFLKTAIGGSDINKMPIGMIMTRMPNVVVCQETDSILEAAKKIITHEIDSLPVVVEHCKDGELLYKVVGRFSKTNIAIQFVELGL
ncbi:MAG: helix-turn-helix transcriptional regulator [Clostridia bacterium]|nr:helix-turn-helix transcriptional regulator [Clostridia bacterium]